MNNLSSGLDSIMLKRKSLVLISPLYWNELFEIERNENLPEKNINF